MFSLWEDWDCMSMMSRFTDIMAGNINSLLDKEEDPDKMMDQFVRNLNKDLAKVKSETASVMAEVQRSKRVLNECQDEIEKMERYCHKALEAGNEGDARRFQEKKASFEAQLSDKQASHQMALSNSQKIKQMHDKLVADISELISTEKFSENETVCGKDTGTNE